MRIGGLSVMAVLLAMGSAVGASTALAREPAGQTPGAQSGQTPHDDRHATQEPDAAAAAPDAGPGQATPDGPATPVPAVTDADRAAAFPEIAADLMPVDDSMPHGLVQLDEVEWQDAASGSRFGWDGHGWFGGDRHRLWFRTEGEADEAGVHEGELHLLYGRPVARWWDLVVGVRQDVRPAPAQTWAAVGVQGLAPYWFEIEATAYLSDRGRTAARLEAEYELLLTNRVILQPRLELNLYGKSHVARRIGAGLSAAEAELRLRYEVRRELAPYVGVAWHRVFGQTRDLAEAAGEETGGARLVAGVRVWY